MSNIAIVYGYGFDKIGYDDDIGFDLPGGIAGIGCYSVSAYDPDTFVVGVRVMEDVSMFFPTEFENNITDEQKELMKSWTIPDHLSSKLMNVEPKLFVFGYTDD